MMHRAFFDFYIGSILLWLDILYSYCFMYQRFDVNFIISMKANLNKVKLKMQKININQEIQPK